jgi:hypothetical protein
MSLENLSAQLGNDLSGTDGQKKKALPPVELWDPPYCGEIDLQIKADGSWFYNGSVFKRLSLVQLFASVLKRELNENTDEYFLVTPVEKVKITVEDAPFVLTQWQWLDDSSQPVMQVTTSLGDEFILDAQHPLMISDSGSLYVTVRRNLLAKVHRNVYYQWVDLAKEINTEEGTVLMFFSGEQGFSLGLLE